MESIRVGVLCLSTSFLLLCLQLTLEEEEEAEQNCILAGCCFATLALLTSTFGCLVSKGSSQKG